MSFGGVSKETVATANRPTNVLASLKLRILLSRKNFKGVGAEVVTLHGGRVEVYMEVKSCRILTCACRMFAGTTSLRYPSRKARAALNAGVGTPHKTAWALIRRQPGWAA